MSRRPQHQPDPAGKRLWFYWLTPGISHGNALTLMFSGFSLISLFTFNSFVQPYLLQEVLLIPEENQGSLIGSLQFVQELVVILLVSFIGASSDRLGRRVVYVTGVCLLATGFVIYPLADTELQLFGVRIFYSLGFAAASVMLHICLAEYSQDATRGRWMGTIGVLNGSGVVLMALLLSRLPSWYVAAGFDSVEAIRLSYWTFAAYLFLLAVLLRVGLSPGTVNINRQDSSIEVATRGFAEARKNPRILLAYAMAFASRGDLAVLTAFFSLWLVQKGNEMGLTAAEATVKAGMFFGLSQAAGLLWSFPIGFILDRLQRMTAMCVAFGLASVGYFALGQIDNPFGSAMLVACVLAGMGESSAVVAAGVLIGQEAPARSRGAVLGTFSLMGAFGIMLLTFTGGVVFDAIGQTAPFTMMAIINFAVLLAALTLRLREGRAVGPASTQSESS
ncbi:MAG: MFS transporter [Gammaproteobacteria bacterium]|nr:MFS transporter [Gammaproteobacteria bacterium]